MVDFNRLRTQKNTTKAIDPIEIFRRLPKPIGINDIYTSQADVLQAWFERREEKDIVLKLHTGGGKTLVGLLIAQSTLNEKNEPVLYLTPTVQLVKQTIDKANLHGIPAVEYIPGQALSDDFLNSKAIMIGTYKSLFNGKSKFGIQGRSIPQKVGGIILDDAHAAFSVVRDSFTLVIDSKENRDRYEKLTGLFRKSFKDIDRLGTFDDILSGLEYAVLEVPYWSWHEQLDAVREQIRIECQSDDKDYNMVWPLLRDQLHLCHALISRKSFTITPVLPLVNAFPTFNESPRRIYMSATIADDSDIVRTFDANPDAVKNALTSRSLAGISERMILIPELMKFGFNTKSVIDKLSKWVISKNLGTAILVPSDDDAKKWSDVGIVAKGSKQVEDFIEKMQTRVNNGPFIFANRYDGIDLPGDSCRLLVMSGLPAGTSNYEIFKASTLFGGATITRMLAQRIEQGIGRGARGAGDHCVILLVGSELSAWISKDANFQFLTSATKAQLEMGSEISKEVNDLQDLAQTIQRCLLRDKEWVEYHAETLAEYVHVEKPDDIRFILASIERKAVNLWQDGYYDQAISKIEKILSEHSTIDIQMRGWLEQIAARIADQWGNKQRAEEMQRRAFSHNRNLVRPQILPPYRSLVSPGEQAIAITKQINEFRFRLGFMHAFEENAANLHPNASANQFEQALSQLGEYIGLSSERFDDNGEGPDVLWLLPNKVGFVIEAKSRKKEKNAFTKEQHGQLLVAAEWFAQYYPDFSCIRISIHPNNLATKAAIAGETHVLTYEKLNSLISDARGIILPLCESQLSLENLTIECEKILSSSPLKADCLLDNYLVPFKVKNDK